MSNQKLIMEVNIDRDLASGRGFLHVEVPVNRLWGMGVERHAKKLDPHGEAMVLKAPPGTRWFEDGQPIGDRQPDEWQAEMLVHKQADGEAVIESVLATDRHGVEYASGAVKLSAICDAINEHRDLYAGSDREASALRERLVGPRDQEMIASASASDSLSP